MIAKVVRTCQKQWNKTSYACL